MTFISQNDYDDYAFWMLMFRCDDCHAVVEPPEDYDRDLGEEYQYAIARRAESADWYISFANREPGVNGAVATVASRGPGR